VCWRDLIYGDAFAGLGGGKSAEGESVPAGLAGGGRSVCLGLRAARAMHKRICQSARLTHLKAFLSLRTPAA
jgi:hypothetical protein